MLAPLRARHRLRQRRPEVVYFTADVLDDLVTQYMLADRLGGSLPKPVRCRQCREPLGIGANERGFVTGDRDEAETVSPDGQRTVGRGPLRARLGVRKFTTTCPACGHKQRIYGSGTPTT